MQRCELAQGLSPRSDRLASSVSSLPHPQASEGACGNLGRLNSSRSRPRVIRSEDERNRLPNHCRGRKPENNHHSHKLSTRLFLELLSTLSEVEDPRNHLSVIRKKGKLCMPKAAIAILLDISFCFNFFLGGMVSRRQAKKRTGGKDRYTELLEGTGGREGAEESKKMRASNGGREVVSAGAGTECWCRLCSFCFRGPVLRPE